MAKFGVNVVVLVDNMPLVFFYFSPKPLKKFLHSLYYEKKFGRSFQLKRKILQGKFFYPPPRISNGLPLTWYYYTNNSRKFIQGSCRCLKPLESAFKFQEHLKSPWKIRNPRKCLKGAWKLHENRIVILVRWIPDVFFLQTLWLISRVPFTFLPQTQNKIFVIFKNVFGSLQPFWDIKGMFYFYSVIVKKSCKFSILFLKSP